MTTCLSCEKSLSKRNAKFCNNQCQSDYKYKNYIEKWLLGEETGIRGKDQMSLHVRRYLFEINNDKCCKCGWGELNPYTEKSPLEIHHIDGNYKNNKIDNLQLLCPNCHSLTENYKALNIGKGRNK